MAMEASRQKLESLSTPSPLVFLLSEDGENTSVCSITDIKQTINYAKVSDELRGKTILGSFYGWFVLIKDVEVYLWNPLTLESIGFPPLNLRPEQSIFECLLTSPPKTEESKLILFEEEDLSIIFCMIGSEQWTHHLIGEYGLLLYPVMFNRKLYAVSETKLKLVEIDLSMPNHARLNLLDQESKIPDPDERGLFTNRGYMVESGGELFLVYFCMGSMGKSDECDEVSAVKFFILDFSSMEWKKVESFKDRSFFFDSKSGFSCSTVGSEIGGNCVYFTFDDHKCIYLYNMDEKTISVSILKCEPFWVTTNSRNSIENKIDALYNVNEEERKFDVQKLLTNSVMEEDAKGVDVGKLHSDILFEIGKRLILGDYMSFRSVNIKCFAACPPIKWTQATLGIFDGYTNSSIPPWLTFSQEGDEICRCFDFLCKEWYFINLPNNTFKDVTMCYSTAGWCVMLRGENSVFLWNPLTKKTVLLPPNDTHNENVRGCTMSSTMDQIFLILYEDKQYRIRYMYLKKGEWLWIDLTDYHTNSIYIDIEVEMNNNLVSYEWNLYSMDAKGDITVFEVILVDIKEGTTAFIEKYEKLTTLCSSIYQSFLMEYNGKLLAIYVGFLGEWVRIFTVDYYAKIKWVEIENLENTTVYVSRFSNFGTAPLNPAMENKVYFPRYHVNSNNIIYYSLKSKKFHVHGTDEVLEKFDDTKMQLFSNWVELKWD